MIIDIILSQAALILDVILTTNIIWWFTGTSIVVTVYAFVTNHLGIRRLAIYAALFWLLLIGIEGPIINFSIVVLKVSPTNPVLYRSAIFIFYFFTSVLIGLTTGFIINRSLIFFLGDYWRKLGGLFHRIGNALEKKSGNDMPYTSLEEVAAVARQKHAAKLKAQQNEAP